MNPQDNIEKSITELVLPGTKADDERILNDALAAYEKTETKKMAEHQPIVWRMIMNKPITKLTTVAATILIVVLGITFLDKAVTPAWAEIVQTVEQSYNQYYADLLSAMEQKDAHKASANADALSEFWQGINMLAKAKLDPTIGFQPEDSLKLIKEKTSYNHYEQGMQQIFLAYSNEFVDWLNKIEDDAWINEIVHISKEMEEYAEEIREPGRHPEIDFSYAEHCLLGFVTYCEWFELLPWDNPEQIMTPAVILAAIERDLQIGRREIDTMERRDADRVGKRCMRQALKNSQILQNKIKSSQMVNQWKLCNQLTQKVSELSGLMAYLAVASGDVTQTNKFHIPEKVHQILTEKFANRESFADYFIEQVDQGLDLCQQLHKGLEYTQ